MSEVNDRGTKKWVSLMMPEHIQMLKDMWEENEKMSKAMLDEQELEEINMKLQMAIHNNLTVEVKYYKKGYNEIIEGKLSKIDNVNKTLIFRDTYSTKVSFADIIDVTIK